MDLYAILGIDSNATKTQIKKAYHKAALSSHPDKVAEGDRAAAEIEFKSISKAYEILYDDEKRHIYDIHGISAFDASQGNGTGAGVDLEEMLQQMFSMGTMPQASGGTGQGKQRKGKDEEQTYQVTLEDLYKGKTTKFSMKKNVICTHCKGIGGKEKAKSKQCASCQGRGFRQGLRSLGPGLVTQETVTCDSCKGTGTLFREKDRCKKCKGERITEAQKYLELYIPRGSKEGDRIVLEGEADQVPNQVPGNIIFELVETPHSVFRRSGADLSANLEVTLAEALCGFSRVVIKHLDGRGLNINHSQPQGRVLRPGQVLKITGEGMPHKKSEMKGDLYLTVLVEFPEDGWLLDHTTIAGIQHLLPKSKKPILAETVDDVEYDEDASIDGFGGDEPGSDAWEDDDDDGGGEQCAQQ